MRLATTCWRPDEHRAAECSTALSPPAVAWRCPRSPYCCWLEPGQEEAKQVATGHRWVLTADRNEQHREPVHHAVTSVHPQSSDISLISHASQFLKFQICNWWYKMKSRTARCSSNPPHTLMCELCRCGAWRRLDCSNTGLPALNMLCASSL
jgi:hypothetical protein